MPASSYDQVRRKADNYAKCPECGAVNKYEKVPPPRFSKHDQGENDYDEYLKMQATNSEPLPLK